MDVESALACGVSKVLRVCNQEGLLCLFWMGCCALGTEREGSFLEMLLFVDCVKSVHPNIVQARVVVLLRQF